jgi:hypothetical protein
MLRRLPVLLLTLTAVLLLAMPVFAQPPSFGPAIYADGKMWATQGVATLPPPNDHDAQSFDQLFRFTNPAPGQLPVAEAAPGNPIYNGGRWNAFEVTWNIPDPPVVTSYAELMQHAEDFTMVSANDYFECPLRPVKD